MAEHGGGISSIEEEGNREHAAGTPSIMENDEVDSTHSTSSKDSIFRIPGLFKMRNEQAYTPYKFSIGPWHFGKTQLLRTGQKLKESFLIGLTNRFPDPAAKKRELVEAIRNVHNKARECYEGEDVYKGQSMDVVKEFEEILLLDGCFIIELFRKHAVLFSENVEQVPIKENEFVHFLTGMIHVIYHDLLLLDNQIPWFVLELLFDKTNEYLPCMNLTLVELAMKFFGHVSGYEPRQELQRLLSEYNSDITHLVDFVWRFWDVSSERRRIDFELFDYETLIPSATRLKEAGVKFQKAESRNILDVKFNKGVLEIPPLLISPSTETIFSNLIIFEQCSLCMPRVTSYAILLDCLVDTSDDVHLTNGVGILDNRLNPEETANFLNRVRDNTFTRALLCTTSQRCQRILR
ncbi:hypothetical protein SLE2022_175750 [Rubroshorea leprosula]